MDSLEIWKLNEVLVIKEFKIMRVPVIPLKEGHRMIDKITEWCLE